MMGQIIRADARAIPLADASVQCVVTSPPYFGLRDYGVTGQIGLEPTPDAYVSTLVQVFREVWRVLRDDGVCWLNLGSSYFGGGNGGGGSFASERPGWSVFGDRTPSRSRSDVPAWKQKDMIPIPWMVAMALQADGWYLRQDIIWHKPNPMPESVRDRCTKAHEYLFLLTKQERYFWDASAMAEPSTNSDSGNVTRKSNAAAALGRGDIGASIPYKANSFRNRRSVWTIDTQPYSGAHFAVMPEKLVKPCVLDGTRLGDLVLDPFCGSGTVMRVAYRLGRECRRLPVSRQGR